MSGIHQSVVSTFISTGPKIGDSYEGGYFAGKIVQGGTTYNLVVAPKSSGQNSGKEYKTDNSAAPSETQTLNNGVSASSSMNSASYPAAQFCEGLSIGGFSDWYMPSRDELELCYRNLKPTTASNYVDETRPKSTIIYPENNDVSGDGVGVNRNSNPTGAAYTVSSPAQTAVEIFKSGETEAFSAALYWSSSEFSDTKSWIQNFAEAFQFSEFKFDVKYVRAVRRVSV